MNNSKKLIIYNFDILFSILTELKSEFNYELEILKSNEINKIQNSSENFDLIINQKEIPNIKNQLTLIELPIKIMKLIEEINVKVLKNSFENQSEISIGKFQLNLNSRELSRKNQCLKLTEKETNIIIFLLKSKKPIGVNQLQNEVWSYQSDLETHTVETHIYRLRKKIHEKFSDNNFIISTKDGYKIN